LGIGKITPVNTTKYILDPLNPEFFNPIYKLQAEKVIDAKDDSGNFIYKVLGARHLLSIDASQYHSYQKIYCEHCYTKQKTQKFGDKITEYS
jgi:hypothetical protein